MFKNLSCRHRAQSAPVDAFDGHLPDAALKEAITALPQADPSGGRLIDNRAGCSANSSLGLRSQAVDVATKVVMGAGIYQSAVGTDFVPKRVLLELVKAGVLESNCRASLIANPGSCPAWSSGSNGSS